MVYDGHVLVATIRSKVYLKLEDKHRNRTKGTSLEGSDETVTIENDEAELTAYDTKNFRTACCHLRWAGWHCTYEQFTSVPLGHTNIILPTSIPMSEVSVLMI